VKDIMTVTLKDIAQQLNLSVTTVSRALAGYSDVAEKTRQRVEQAAREMGYYPNITARQLQKQRTDTLAFIIPTHGPRFSDPFFSELLAGIGNEAGRHGYALLVATQSPDSDAEREAYRQVVYGRRADGAIVVRTRRNDSRIQFLCQESFAFVAFGRADVGCDFSYVDEDSHAGLQLLTQHLIDLGHRHIGFISPPNELMFTQFRLAGYRDTLHTNGLPFLPSLVVEGDLTQSGGVQAAQTLLALRPRPTAIIACNDLMALGVASAAQKMGLSIPHELSIGGFDDIPLAEHAIPSLTTVRQPIYEIGRRLSRMVVQLVQDQPHLGNDWPSQVLLTPELVVRDSGGPPPDRPA
jgi:LacI family transcriptional regulator